jgi:glutaredoxin 3
MFWCSLLPPALTGYIYDNYKRIEILRAAMADVTIYTTQFCPYCVAAKNLLRNKGATFQEIDVSFDPSQRKTMSERAGGRRTVPQIFIGEQHIGGCDDLFALDRRGGLDSLLGV